MRKSAPVGIVALTAVLTLGLAACGGTSQVSNADPTHAASRPAAAPTEDPVVDEPTEEPQGEFTQLSFGDTLAIEKSDGATGNVTLGQPKKAKCQYASIGCDKPEIGDRVVEVPIIIENTGDSTIEWSRSYFILEFADGTQVEMGDGASSDYTPDNALDYDTKVRVGGKLKSSLVFEAPDGPFSVLLLTGTFGGEPFAAWS